MKRKNEGPDQLASKAKKRAISDEEAKKCFHYGLFSPAMLEHYTKQYADSEP
jgi:prolyl 3-hydroxylase /prolyl 3,4-dihydroxylase